MTAAPLPVDEGLLTRFRAAGKLITWRRAPATRGRPRGKAASGVRIAHLNDEDCRVEERTHGPERTVCVDSGPVGALVLLLEVDRVGPPSSLSSQEAGAVDGFPQGAIEARWGGVASTRTPLPVRDLVDLARYALA